MSKLMETIEMDYKKDVETNLPKFNGILEDWDVCFDKNYYVICKNKFLLLNDKKIYDICISFHPHALSDYLLKISYKNDILLKFHIHMIYNEINDYFGRFIYKQLLRFFYILNTLWNNYNVTIYKRILDDIDHSNILRKKMDNIKNWYI